jgi:hypothetical protein
MRLEAGLKVSLGKPTYLNLNVPTNMPMFEGISPLEHPVHACCELKEQPSGLDWKSQRFPNTSW